MSIKRKILSGFFAIVILISTVGYFCIELSRQIGGLRTVELPMEQNLREVEVSVWEAIHAANAFRITGEKTYEERYKKQMADVDRFFPKYTALIDTEEERGFISEFNVFWEKAKHTGVGMIQLAKELKSQEKIFFESIYAADQILNHELQKKWSVDDQNVLVKEKTLKGIEVSLWQAFNAGNQYGGASGNVQGYNDVLADSLIEINFYEVMVEKFADVDDFLSEYKDLASNDLEKEALEKFDHFWFQAIGAGERVTSLYEEAQSQFLMLYKHIEKADFVVDNKMQNFIQSRIDKKDAIAARIRNTTFSIILFAVVMAIGTGLFIASSITKPVNTLTESAAAIAEKAGDLTRKIEVKSKDELGQLGTTFNKLISGLREIIMEVLEVNVQVSSSVTQINSAAHQQEAGAIEQSTSVTEIASTIKQLSTTAFAIATNAENVVEISQNTVISMEEINVKIEETSQKILALWEKSQSIGNITVLISDIAEKTNLLALNAAIEAARAGDAGLGFSVVAQEVRKLAERSSTSSSEIRQLTTDIQNDINSSIVGIEDSTKCAAKGLEMVKEASQSAIEISTATRQQRTASDQVLRAVEEIADSTKQFTAATKQTKHSAAQLIELVKDLTESLSEFKTEEKNTLNSTAEIVKSETT